MPLIASNQEFLQLENIAFNTGRWTDTPSYKAWSYLKNEKSKKSHHDIHDVMEPTALFELTLFNNNAKQQMASSSVSDKIINIKNNANDNMKPSLSTVRFEADRNSLDKMVVELEKVNDIFTKFA